MAEVSPLRRRMIEDMSVRKLAATTQQFYLHHVSNFSRYFGLRCGAVTRRPSQRPPGVTFPSWSRPCDSFGCLLASSEDRSRPHDGRQPADGSRRTGYTRATSRKGWGCDKALLAHVQGAGCGISRKSPGTPGTAGVYGRVALFR